jgi:hypothetical protein
VVECTHNYGNGTCETLFGYESDCDDIVQRTVQAGEDNYFSPPPADRGQPTLFHPGRQHHVFSVRWSCSHHSRLSWILNGTAVASSEASNCPVDCDGRPCEPEDECSNEHTGALIVPSATLQLYRDRDFDDPILLGDPWQDPVQVGDTSYGVVTLDVPELLLEEFCMALSRVRLCARTVPYNPLQPSSTGCQTPGAQRVVLYDPASNITQYGFALVRNPPQDCHGKVAFRWTNQALSTQRLLVEADWTEIGEVDTGRSLMAVASDYQSPADGSSSTGLELSCPRHYVLMSHGCVRHRSLDVWLHNNNNQNNINITIVNVINDSDRNDNRNDNSNNNNNNGGGDDGRGGGDDEWGDGEWVDAEPTADWSLLWWAVLALVLLAIGLCLCCHKERTSTYVPVPVPVPSRPSIIVRQQQQAPAPGVQQRKPALPPHLADMVYVDEERAMGL